MTMRYCKDCASLVLLKAREKTLLLIVIGLVVLLFIIISCHSVTVGISSHNVVDKLVDARFGPSVDDAKRELQEIHSQRLRASADAVTEPQEIHSQSLRPCTSTEVRPLNESKGWKQFEMVLRKYKLFHRNKLRLLKEHSTNYKSGVNDSRDVPRTLTWSCGDPLACSGLGDQLYRIQLMFLLAIAYDRVFTIYWNEKDFQTTHYLEPNEIDWTFFDENLGLHKQPDVEHQNTTSITELANLLASPRRHVTVTNGTFLLFWRAYQIFTEVKHVKAKFKAMGLADMMSSAYSRSKTNEEVIPFLSGKILRYLFHFSEEVISRVEETQKVLGIHDQKYLAIHLRTGFVGTEFEEIGDFNDLKVDKHNESWVASLECSLRIADETIGPNASIFFAVDSYKVKNWALHQYSGRIVAIDIPLQHIALENSWKNTEDKDVFLGTWVDFLLLARSHILVHGASGFSTVASSLYSIPPHRQICLPQCTPGPCEYFVKNAACTQAN